MDNPIRVLIVDDSILVRELMIAVIDNDPRFKVVGVAENGLKGVEISKQLKPDIVVMDIEMPLMNGYEATSKIMIEDPRPIVIVSGHIKANEIHSSLDALSAGALAVRPRLCGIESDSFDAEKADLLLTLEAMTEVSVVRKIKPKVQVKQDDNFVAEDKRSLVPDLPLLSARRFQVLAIAASTGGPQSLQSVLSRLPTDFALPILVIQHIGEGFAKGFADWLDSCIHLQVKLAEDGELPVPGVVYVAPDGHHLGISRHGRVELLVTAPVGGFRPSADVLFASASDYYRRSLIAVILSGMGSDGVAGLGKVKARGGLVIAQSKDSSVVYGMPGETVRAGYADFVSDPKDIAKRICELAP